MHFAVLVIGEDPEKQLDQFYDEYWDWHLLGGRWLGHFKLKDGCVGTIGNHYSLTSSMEGMYDQFRKGDLDIKGTYEVWYNFISREIHKGLSILRNSTYFPYTPLESGNEELNKGLLKHYREQSVFEILHKEAPRLYDYLYWCELNTNLNILDLFKIQDEIIEYLIPCIEPSIVVIDGDWNNLEEDEFQKLPTKKERWLAFVEENIKHLPDDTLLSLYDCHM